MTSRAVSNAYYSENVDDILDTEAVKDEDARERRRLMFRLGSSFFLFGVINNVLYVIILSAALDLVPPSTPKGIIAFCNIFPALMAKIGWPYLLRGRIRYAKRLLGCCALSVSGMVVVAAFDSLPMRLLGICFSSFASGLGELTFLQLSTTYHPPAVAGLGLSYFASGTGAAGLVGALLWWEVRSFGVRVGVSLSAILPLVIPLTYSLVLPRPTAFATLDLPSSYGDGGPDVSTESSYAPVAASEDEVTDDNDATIRTPLSGPLTMEDKWRLAKPLLLQYMLPLFCVYLFEYTINQGISPTLIYPVPSPEDYPLLGFIHSIRDYYPLWQLVYQSSVFLSRSSISLGLPPLPARLLYLPAVVQGIILFTLFTESALGLVPESSEGLAVTFVFLLISLEGICGGSAYVNVFYRINQEPFNPEVDHERAKQEKEFKIGSIGLADSLGILTASIVAVPTEVYLCNAQASRGKLLCKSL
ncbi:batten's disease protein Cln3 [Amylostereum chailletii]|nr:batten's disease protein Cln3 [Amylostereum chailletii]